MSEPSKDPAADGNGEEKPAEASAEPTVEQAPPPPDPVAALKTELAKARDQLLRTAADFDNFRKRSRRELEEANRKGAEDLLRNLLPVFDNLERAVIHADQTADAKAIAEGVRMVLKQFTDTLARTGITRVPGVGTAFDPLVHEAIQSVETAEHSPGTVVAEVAPGYKFGDRLVRPAMVVVAKPPPSDDSSKPPEN